MAIVPTPRFRVRSRSASGTFHPANQSGEKMAESPGGAVHATLEPSGGRTRARLAAGRTGHVREATHTTARVPSLPLTGKAARIQGSPPRTHWVGFEQFSPMVHPARHLMLRPQPATFRTLRTRGSRWSEYWRTP